MIFGCFPTSGWRVFGVFGRLIAIFLRTGIYFGTFLLLGSCALLLQMCVGFELHRLAWRLGNLLASMVWRVLCVCGVWRQVFLLVLLRWLVYPQFHFL